MASIRRLPSFALITGLVLTLTASAGGPWGRGGSSSHGGTTYHGGATFHGGAGYRGGTVLRGGPRGSFGPGWSGRPVRVLPRGYVSYHWGGNPWFYNGGFWYRPWGGAYVGCYPPIGLCIPLLPLGYSTIWFNDVRYYAYEDVYYTDAPSGGYAVAEPPPRDTPRPSAAPDAAALDALLILPKEGQSEEKMKADRAAAQRYAIQKSGYDPAYSDASDPGTPRARKAYLRFLRDYLEERGYSVK